MQIVLSILDLLVVVTVVVSVVRAVWRGQPENSRSVLLAAFIAVALFIFGLVSLAAAAGLAADSTQQIVLLVFLVAIAITARMAWTSQTA